VGLLVQQYPLLNLIPNGGRAPQIKHVVIHKPTRFGEPIDSPGTFDG
jgi:hypothetical protein